MPDYLLKTLVQSSFSLTAPDELDGSSTVGDTLSPILLARAAFFTFLLMGIGFLYTKTLTVHKIFLKSLKNLTMQLARIRVK